METQDARPRLRASLDGNDSFLSGGHGIIKTAGATKHASRMQRVPVWALNDNAIKKLIKRCFPKQRKDLVSRMLRIIYLYYRVGSTAGAVAEELKVPVKTIENVIYRLNKTANRPAKPRGRPKNSEGIQAASGRMSETVI